MTVYLTKEIIEKAKNSKDGWIIFAKKDSHLYSLTLFYGSPLNGQLAMAFSRNENFEVCPYNVPKKNDDFKRMFERIFINDITTRGKINKFLRIAPDLIDLYSETFDKEKRKTEVKSIDYSLVDNLEEKISEEEKEFLRQEKEMLEKILENENRPQKMEIRKRFLYAGIKTKMPVRIYLLKEYL